MNNIEPQKSPVSNFKPVKIAEFPRQKLLLKLSEYFGEVAPPNIVDIDYSLWRCSETGMEFSWPSEPGSAAFYEWISSFPNYYPEDRWEYRVVANDLRNMAIAVEDLAVLDVGCGSGTFLGHLSFLNPKNRYGIDFNDPAVRECERKGLQAFCGSLEQGLQSGFIRPHQFQVVTSFHCLEHVAEPESFVKELLNVTSDSGSIFLSTPASPMSFEVGWFDVMNHPPHHMTRWNLKAYKQLAANLGLQIKFDVRRAHLLKQAIALEELKAYGPNRRHSRRERALRLISHIPDLLESLWRLQRRAWHHPLGGSDLILVELRKQ